MRNEIDARKAAHSVNVEDTGFARLLHARLYGNERPYQDHGINTLVEGYNTVLDKYSADDDYYFFETQALKLNFSIVNTGHVPLENVSVLLNVPWADQFRTADRLYGPRSKPVSAKESELMGYPRVKRYQSAVQIKQEIPRLEPDEANCLYEQALRISVKPELAGKKVAIRYSVLADGFDRPEEGRLKLVLGKPQS